MTTKRRRKRFMEEQDMVVIKHLKNMNGDKRAMLVDIIDQLTRAEFTGYLKVNFSQGGIGRVEKFEEIMKGK
jgi:hypothetical protein